MLPLKPGTVIPMFEGQGLDGARLSRAIWRGRAALVLLLLPDDLAAHAYLTALDAAAAAWTRAEQAVAVLRRPPPEAVPNVAVVLDTTGTLWPQLAGDSVAAWMITDRYGELYTQGAAASVSQLPAPTTLHEWAEWVGMRCGG